MRLTTRLMQVASWLLVQRAVREGDMNPAEACQERYRLAEPTEDGRPAPADELPAGLLQLLDRSARLYERVLHLDRRMYREEPASEADHPVLSQIEKLQAAFSRS
jgi:regulator of CtrA degradation